MKSKRMLTPTTNQNQNNNNVLAKKNNLTQPKCKV